MDKHVKLKHYPSSDHFDGNKFHNPGHTKQKNFFHVWRMLKELRNKNKWPTCIENQCIPVLAPALSPDETYITYINHASHMIQLKDLNILTDPIFSKRAGPFALFGPKRVRKPGIDFQNLPHIDLVVVSHNHYDHMDLSTLKMLAKKFQPTFIVPLGNHKYLSKKIFRHVIELDWWETHRINDTQSVTLVPAEHWSRRKLNDTNKALWGGFWIQSSELKLYFSGDTGYADHFKLMHAKLGSPDISILPIGAYEPRWFMKDFHMNPEEAVLASLDLKSRFSIATHYQTFRLSMEKIDDPVLDLQRSKLAHDVADDKFIAPETGASIKYHRDTGIEWL